MKKIILIAVALFSGAVMVSAQDGSLRSLKEKEVQINAMLDSLKAGQYPVCAGDTLNAECDTLEKKHGHGHFYVGVEGAAALSLNENWRAFFKEGQGWQLVKPMPSIQVGWYFIPRLGVRLGAEWSRNTSACNYEQEQVQAVKFRPYNFNNFAVFGDLILNGGKVSEPKPFNWRFFAGVGYAYSYKFTEPAKGATHPYVLSYPNHCLGFRLGFILEYIFDCGVGIMFEGNHEWFTDAFNGMDPRSGFPFDFKFNNGLGVTFHF